MMAVQACPTEVLLPDLRDRTRQTVAGEGMNLLSASAYCIPTDYQQLQSACVAGSPGQLRLFGSIAPGNPVQKTYSQVVCDSGSLGCDMIACRKRPREVENVVVRQRRQQLINVVDFQRSQVPSAVIIPQSAGVSTGLKLAFEDERLNPKCTSTSGRGDGSSFLSLIENEVSSQLHQQSDEIDQYLRAQGMQLRQHLDEARQRHSKSLLAAIEGGIVKRLRSKDMEVEKITTRNKDLEERVNQLTIEAHLWQKQAKNNEAMVTALRYNLQQAVALSREQSREGCGDSEADDAASSHQDNLADAEARALQENKELKEQRTCRVCQSNDVSILLLPCRHLCLCKECETRLNACPICRSIKNASVQVYMS